MSEKKKILIALGGNALGSSFEEEVINIKKTAEYLSELVKEDKYKIVITHGNGPQVGRINEAMENEAKIKNTKSLPLYDCGAMSQGYIGLALQRQLNTEFKKLNLDKKVVTMISQVLVSKEDKAFENPSKPIGIFYTKEEAQKLEQEGFYLKEDSGRGYRKMVASPKPLDIIEKDAIKNLYEQDFLVIAGGGGGIPIAKEDLCALEAVVDKDFTSAKLSEILGVDIFIILTGVDKVCINFGKENEKQLDNISLEEAKKYLVQGEFGEGSMKPKIEAGIEFLQNTENTKFLIASLENLTNALDGKTGTVIER